MKSPTEPTNGAMIDRPQTTAVDPDPRAGRREGMATGRTTVPSVAISRDPQWWIHRWLFGHITDDELAAAFDRLGIERSTVTKSETATPSGDSITTHDKT